MRDARRRNRNIGTAKQGHGQDNHHDVPAFWQKKVYEWTANRDHVVVHRQVWGRSLPFLVERTLDDSVHPCTVDDIATLLNALPKSHLNTHEGIEGIQGILLCQPTRKQDALRPVWGRMVYFVQVKRHFGPVIQLSAQKVPTQINWDRKLTPEDRLELARLQGFADESRTDSRHHSMTFGLEGLRRVLLYHTLPHELGHWVDMLEKVERPSMRGGDKVDYDVLCDRYFQRPSAEREKFAHTYADEARSQLTQDGAIPFERKLDRQALEGEGLRWEDFSLNAGE